VCVSLSLSLCGISLTLTKRNGFLFCIENQIGKRTAEKRDNGYLAKIFVSIFVLEKQRRGRGSSLET
jgi:uncharacterized protein Veg